MKSISERATELELNFIDNNKDWSLKDKIIGYQTVGVENSESNMTLMDLCTELIVEYYTKGANDQHTIDVKEASDMYFTVIKDSAEWIEEFFGFGKTDFLEHAQQRAKEHYK